MGNLDEPCRLWPMADPWSLIAAVGETVAVLGSGFLMTWRVAKAAADLDASRQRQTEDSAAMRLELVAVSKRLEILPVIQNDVGNLQIQVQRFHSAFPEMKNKIAVIETRLVHLESRPRIRSRHDEDE